MPFIKLVVSCTKYAVVSVFMLVIVGALIHAACTAIFVIY